MTTERPWMPFYPQDYLADTGRLTTEQHGAYFLLILDYWLCGPPPDDDEQLAAIARMDIKAWKKTRPRIVVFFHVEGGLWHHKRIDAEIDRANSYIKAKSEAGTVGAKIRWQNHRKPNGRHIADA